MTPPTPAFSPDWREGRFFDLWMLAHVASGVAGGFSNVFFGLSTAGVYAVALLMMSLWEFGEYLQGVRESWSNRILDIVVGMIGVQIALWIAAPISRRSEFIAFVTTFGLALGLNITGWIAFRRRRAAETKA